MYQNIQPTTGIQQFIKNGLLELGIRETDILFREHLQTKETYIRIAYWRKIQNFEDLTWLHPYLIECSWYEDDCGLLYTYDFKKEYTKDLQSITF